MKEIAERLHENRQIQLAKEILENAGYKVTKKLDESFSVDNILSQADDIIYNNFSQKEVKTRHDEDDSLLTRGYHITIDSSHRFYSSVESNPVEFLRDLASQFKDSVSDISVSKVYQERAGEIRGNLSGGGRIVLRVYYDKFQDNAYKFSLVIQYETNKVKSKGSMESIVSEFKEKVKEVGVSAVGTEDNWDNPDEVVDWYTKIAAMLEADPESIYIITEDEFSARGLHMNEEDFDKIYDVLKSLKKKREVAKRGDGTDSYLSLSTSKYLSIVDIYDEADNYHSFAVSI